MGKNEDDTDYGWKAMPAMRWARKEHSFTSQPDDLKLQQLWANAVGETEWRDVPLVDL